MQNLPGLPGLPGLPKEKKALTIPPFNLSVAEAAKMVGCAPSTMWEHIRAGNIAVRRMGQRTLIPYENLKEFASKDWPARATLVKAAK